MQPRYKELLDKDELSFEDCLELDSLHDNIEDHLIEYAKYIRNLEAEADAIQGAISEMLDRHTTMCQKAESYRATLAASMEGLGIKKITKSPLFPVTLKKNPVSVDTYDKTAIPENYWNTRIVESKTIDKQAIKKAIENGEEVAGAKLVQKVRVDFK